MSNSTAHCPFLNRSDALCSEVFNLDRLTHAYKFCFDRYHACPRYLQLLSERQHRRGVDAQAGSDDPRPLVQISLPSLAARIKKQLVG